MKHFAFTLALFSALSLFAEGALEVATPVAAAEGAVCPACGKPVEADWKACPWCKAEIVRERVCASCGKKLEPDWVLCPWCKTEVKA